MYNGLWKYNRETDLKIYRDTLNKSILYSQPLVQEKLNSSRQSQLRLQYTMILLYQ